MFSFFNRNLVSVEDRKKRSDKVDITHRLEENPTNPMAYTKWVWSFIYLLLTSLHQWRGSNQSQPHQNDKLQKPLLLLKVAFSCSIWGVTWNVLDGWWNRKWEEKWQSVNFCLIFATKIVSFSLSCRRRWLHAALDLWCALILLWKWNELLFVYISFTMTLFKALIYLIFAYCLCWRKNLAVKFWQFSSMQFE